MLQESASSCGNGRSGLTWKSVKLQLMILMLNEGIAICFIFSTDWESGSWEWSGRFPKEWYEMRTQSGSQQSCPCGQVLLYHVNNNILYWMTFMVHKVLTYYSTKINRIQRGDMTCSKGREENQKAGPMMGTRSSISLRLSEKLCSLSNSLREDKTRVGVWLQHLLN